MPDLESCSFGDSPALADELLELVLIGKKTATCWAASEGDKGVEAGKPWVVKNGHDRPRAGLETVEPTRRAFGDVDPAFALRSEGEGDRERRRIKGAAISLEFTEGEGPDEASRESHVVANIKKGRSDPC